MSNRRGTTAIEDIITDIPNVRISVDPDAFDLAIRSQGVRLVHYTATRCPVGMTDLDDNRRPHEDHAGCSNGFLYERAGIITATLLGNGNQPHLQDVGFVHGASFTTTFPRYYDQDPSCVNCDPKPFYVAAFDRFFLEEEAILVLTWQLARCNETGVDRLNFPAIGVQRLVDSRGDTYKEGQDFDVIKGAIVWKQDCGRRPMNDLETGRGAIISVRYWYRPFWYCARLLHEIRVAQIESFTGDERRLIQMPQQALLNREFLYLNESQDDMARDPRSPRQTNAPDDGGFGPK